MSGRAISPCQISGMVARAFSPRLSTSMGTGRHSRSSKPLAAADSATIALALSSQAKRAATAKSPPSMRCGTWIRSPAPSPLLPSASSPPRCESRASAWTPRATASWPSSGEATKPIPQAARLLGRSPGQARRERRSAGGTDWKPTARPVVELVGHHQKRWRNVMWSSHTQEGLHPQRDRQVEAGFGVLEVDGADLADAVEPVAQRVRVHAQPLGGLLLLARLEVGPEGSDEVALARGVVLDERPKMPPAVVDQPLIGDRGKQPGQPELRHRDHLAPALEAGQRLHHRGHLPERAGDTRGGFGRAAEADRDGEARLPVCDRLLDLNTKSVDPNLVVAHLGAQRKQRHDLVGTALDERSRVAGSHHTGDPAEEIALQRLDRIFRDLTGAVEAAEVVDVDEHHDVAALQRVAEMSGPALGGRFIAVGPVKQVLEELASDPAFDLGQLAFFGHGQRQHQRGLLDRHERELLVVWRVIEDRDVAEHLPAGQDRRNQTLSRHSHVWEWRHLDRRPLGLDFAKHALDLRVEQHARRRPLAEDRLLAVGVGAAAGV